MPKLTQQEHYTVEGEDYVGDIAIGWLGDRSRINIQLTSPKGTNAYFSASEVDEGTIDRLAAAAKAALRELKKIQGGA